jgi:hypothetical protein
LASRGRSIAALSASFRGRPVRGGARGPGDGFVIVKQVVRQETLVEIEPDAFHWVQVSRRVAAPR